MAPLISTALLLSSAPLQLLAFTPSSQQHTHHPNIATALFARVQKVEPLKPSRVIDEDGPSPPQRTDPFPTIDLDDLPEAHYDPHNHPVAHQPWRRGDTDGCHDPITSPWRLEAEAIISDAASIVGAKVVDVTWYMAKCVISLDTQTVNSNVVAYTDGQEVRIEYPDETDISGHVFEDPDVGTENELYTEEDEYLDYEQYDEETEYEILKANLPQEYDEETGDPLPPREVRSREERVAEMDQEWQNRWFDEPRTERPADGMFAHPINTKALATVSKSIVEALSDEDVEKRLRIVSRHDIILTSPLDNPVILDSQKEFNAAEGLDVYVETRDPWGSNRILFGKMVDRNAMDVIINQDNSGRMVTIPNSMIHQVLCVSGLAKGSERVRNEARGEGGTDDEDSDEGDDYDGGIEVEEEDIEEEGFDEDDY